MRGTGWLSSGWIRSLRGERTQEQFAELLGGTVSKAMISKWENDQDEPSTPNCVKLLEFAGILPTNGDATKGVGVASPTMTPIQQAILRCLSDMPEKAQEDVLIRLIKEAGKQHSQEAAALAKKG